MTALVEAWLPLAHRIAAKFYLPGADADDLRQEAAIGLLYAIRDYRPETGVPFEAFAVLCVRRQVITALKAATRAKHASLTHALRIWASDDGEEDARPIDLPDPAAAREMAALEERDALEDLLARLTHTWWHGLTERQRESVLLVASGWSYAEIQALTGAGIKAIDNAVQHARRKLRAAA